MLLALHFFTLPNKHILKVVIKDILLNITNNKMKNELENLNYKIQTVKRFGSPHKPLPIVLIIISQSTSSKEIFALDSLLYLKYSIKAYNSSGPFQCVACQHVGYSSQNCSYALRCVKCAGNHSVILRKIPPMCCNRSGSRTTNYRGCTYLESFTKLQQPKLPTLSINHPLLIKTPLLPSNTPLPSPKPTTLITPQVTTKTYDATTTCKPEINIPEIFLLLTCLLTAVVTNQNTKVVLETTVRSILAILSSFEDD